MDDYFREVCRAKSYYSHLIQDRELPFYVMCKRQSLEGVEHGNDQVDVSRDHENFSAESGGRGRRGEEKTNYKGITMLCARNHAVLDQMLRMKWTDSGYVDGS